LYIQTKKSQLPLFEKSVWVYTLLTIVVAVSIGVILINPFWSRFSPLYSIPKVLPPIAAPVDGPFYIENAEHGFPWHDKDQRGLWFHPLLSFILMNMPKWISTSMWFYFVSIVFAIGSIILTCQLLSVLGKFNRVSSKLLPLILIVPGGLGIATGNAEIPTLFFTLALLLSVLRWQKWWLTFSFAALAILTKPNALYMVPVLFVYFISAIFDRNVKIIVQALIGILSILVVWGMWIKYVDWNSGQSGLYWSLRMRTSQYTAGNVTGFLNHLIGAFLDSSDIREQLIYSIALIIPLANIVIMVLISLPNERDWYAILAGNIAILAIALYMGNPNKIIVYTTTLPGYFITHLLLIEKLVTRTVFSKPFLRFGVAAVYIAYCICMLLIYIVGTPLGWYY